MALVKDIVLAILVIVLASFIYRYRMDAKLPATLQANMGILSSDQQATARLLISLDQGHLFANWPAPGSDDAKKKALLDQAALLNVQYPGGISQYVQNAQTLLENAKKGVNPFDGYTPSVPIGERLNSSEPLFHECEEIGASSAHELAFMLVAGGLGERLGYNGIKIELPYQLTDESSYLQLYAESILELQRRARAQHNDNSILIPFAIMTSDDTHARTVALLESKNFFGLSQDQLTIVKQEKVPAIIDNSGHFALEETDPYQISTKPHGHGDVHMLLHSSGLAAKWTQQGKKWLIFFQDTNALVFHAAIAAVGVSVKHQFVVNTLTVPRRPSEAVGAIMKLDHKNGGSLTINVEYNQLDDLLRSTISPKGDTVDEKTGFSPYPGNINVLVFHIPTYAETLNRTKGGVPEFVNPKYANAEKTVFKKPTRLECMMQDFPRLLDHNAKVGFTQCERWLSFSAVKNSLTEAADKVKATGFAESAASGESDIYYFNRRVLKDIGVDIDVDGKAELFAGIPVHVGALVVLSPRVGITQADIKAKFGADSSDSKSIVASRTSSTIKISNRSALVVNGDVRFTGNLEVDGALVINAVPGAHVTVKNLKVSNQGYQFTAVDVNDKTVPERYRIRGYKLTKSEERVFNFDQSGDFVIDEQ